MQNFWKMNSPRGPFSFVSITILNKYMVGYGLAEWTGFEPATSCVTGRHSNQAELPLLN
jgi:hypothetical protein